MNYIFNEEECRSGGKDACMEGLLEAACAEMILKDEIKGLNEKIGGMKKEIEKRFLKLIVIEKAREKIVGIQNEQPPMPRLEAVPEKNKVTVKVEPADKLRQVALHEEKVPEPESQFLWPLVGSHPRYHRRFRHWKAQECF